MKQNIKNTLYRFVTMRAPKLIGDEEKELGFVQYPNYVPSAFIAPASQATTETERKQAIASAVSSYSVRFNTVTELKTDLSAFYEFVKWLSANKKTLTVAEADAKIASGPFTYNIIEIWEDLHYNILTNGDPYLRDLLLSCIVASSFITDSVNVDTTDEAYRKLACAKVIIDKSLFSNEVAIADTNKNNPISEKSMKREMDAFMAQDYNKELKKIAKEVEKAAKKFKRENQKAKDAYQKTYDQSVKAAYAAATIVERVVTDPDTSETSVVREYQNLVIPDYTFVEEDQLDKNILASRLSNEAVNYITAVETEHGVTTLDEVSTVISDEVQANTDTAFENVDFGTTQVVTGGVSVPVSNPLTNPFSFRICSRNTVGNPNYAIVMAINMPNTSYNVASMTYTMQYADSSNNTSGYFEETKTGSSIMLKLYNGGINLDNTVTEFSGTITFTNGDSYDFTIPNFAKGKCFLGDIIPSDDNVGTPSEAPVAFGIQRLGIADYRKVEQEVCCYVPGEVSHIENIMAREHKLKNVTRTRRQETTDTTSRESESENLTETTSTDRFEMNQEIASMNSQDQSLNASAGIHWGAGKAFGGNANASFANNTSSEESENQAISHAKELTERALDRVEP